MTSVRSLSLEELDALRSQLQSQINADSKDEAGDVQKSVARIVLSLVEFLRQVMERQALRRMEEETLNETQIEELGVALMRLEETVHEIAARFGLTPEELNLDLGPLGRLR